MINKQIVKFREFLLKNNFKYIFLILQKIYLFLFRKINPLNFIFNPLKLLYNRKELLAYKNIHKGKECFIIGGAPSLNKLNLTKLNNKIIITVNKGHLLTELGLKKSNYHLITDDFGYKEIKEENLNFSKKYFYSKIIFPKNKNFTFFSNKISFEFQDDITKSISNPGTIILPSIQIAKYMGFKTIYLLGVDLSFSKEGSHYYKETKGDSFRTLDHSIKNKNNMLKGIQLFGKYLEKKGIQLINLSPIKESLPGINKGNYNNL